jgi:hypothetical protein
MKGSNAMKVNDPLQNPIEQWRPGVETRMLVSARNGAAQLCAFEQWVAPGNGAPTHSHPVEEVLTVREGEAEMWLDRERVIVRAGQSVIVPALRLAFAIAAPRPCMFTRCWLPPGSKRHSKAPRSRSADGMLAAEHPATASSRLRLVAIVGEAAKLFSVPEENHVNGHHKGVFEKTAGPDARSDGWPYRAW